MGSMGFDSRIGSTYAVKYKAQPRMMMPNDLKILNHILVLKYSFLQGASCHLFTFTIIHIYEGTKAKQYGQKQSQAALDCCNSHTISTPKLSWH